MTASYLLASTAALALLLSAVPECLAWKKDIKIAYYTTITLRCDENQTDFPDSYIVWITPDATVLQNTTSKGEFPDGISFVNNTVSILNISKIDEDHFGYYTCVIYNAQRTAITVAMWGVNVDGADFSELERQYRNSAVIGTVAAAVMLVLVGGACAVWHFRYGRRNNGDAEDDLKNFSGRNSHTNPGYTATADIEIAETLDDNAKGSVAVAKVSEEPQDGNETLRL